MKGKCSFLVLLFLLLCPSSARLPSPLYGHSSPFVASKEDEFGGTALRGEVEKLHEERSMLLETIEDLKQTVEQTATAFPELDTTVSGVFVTYEQM